MTTDQLAHYGLISVDTESLGGQEPEKETKNFVSCPIGRAAVSLMMKCDGQLSVYHKFI